MDTKLRLRAVEPSDADWMFEIENNPEIVRYSYQQAPMSAELLRDYAMTYDANPFNAGQLRLMVEKSGSREIVGIADLYEIDAVNMRASVGIVIHPVQQRRGYASEALRLLGEYSRDRLGLNLLTAYVTVDNEASLALFEKCGYQRLCTIPRWYRRGQGFIDAALFSYTF